uniref:Odorant receptor n=2 Tax=Ips typographus TaxID=55986 RepID=A0A8F3EVI2_IPSTY|nr:odorant receptor 27 [Ips typographus]
MRVYPDIENFKITAIYSSTIGLFPWKFMFQDNQVLQQTYRYYSYFIYGSFVIFIITAYVELIIMLNGDVLKMDAICSNICLTLAFTCSALRATVMRVGPNLLKIIEQVMHAEKNPASIEDQTSFNLERKSIKTMRKLSHLYAVAITMIASSKCALAPFEKGEIVHIGNTTIIDRPLIMSAWVPFNKNTHYWAAYIIQIYFAALGAWHVAYVDMFMFNMLGYPIGQLKKLHYYIKNITTLTRNDDSLEEFKNVIRQHQQIISYVKFYNDSMGTFAIFEFLQSSVQIASIFIQTSPSDMNLGQFGFIGGFFIGMLFRLFLYYYTANEVMTESEKVGVSVWESDWYEQPTNLKMALLTVMMRGQRPLYYKIGGFGLMSVQSIVAILKATYTYLTVVVRNN